MQHLEYCLAAKFLVFSVCVCIIVYAILFKLKQIGEYSPCSHHPSKSLMFSVECLPLRHVFRWHADGFNENTDL